MEGIWLVVYVAWIKGRDVYLKSDDGSVVSSVAEAMRFPTERLAWESAVRWPSVDEDHFQATVVRAKVTTILKVEE